MSRNRFDDEFTVHVISSASMQIFGSNTLDSFRNFFNDEIQLSGDWRVALSEIIFPTKIEHVGKLRDTKTRKKFCLMLVSFLDLTMEKNCPS